MAQGNSGSFYLAGTKNMGAMIYWSETYNAAANTHVVSINDITFASSNWYQFTYYLQGSVIVDGNTVASFNSALGTHHVRVDSQYTEYSIEAAPGYANPPYYTGTIYGNADGSKSVTISATIYGYSSDGRGANGFCVSGSQTVALYTVPRRSTISNVRNSGRKNEIIALKIWRENHNLEFPSIYLETLAIDALRGKSLYTPADNFIYLLGYIRDNITSKVVYDPANSNNKLSDELSASEKNLLAQQAKSSLSEQYWESIIW